MLKSKAIVQLATPAPKSSNGVQPPRLFFRTSPSLFSTVGFLPEVTGLSPGKPSSNAVLFCEGFPGRVRCKSFACLKFRGSKMGVPMISEVETDRIRHVPKERRT
jgi:hypothetical protein